MREIKFRAWHINLKMMLPNIQNHIGNDGWGFGHLIKDANVYVMQYAGIKDKNGVEIYEGDIIRAFGKNYEVKFIQTDNELFVDYGYPSKHNGPAPHWIEVIGNIYENPELIKEQEYE